MTDPLMAANPVVVHASPALATASSLAAPIEGQPLAQGVNKLAIEEFREPQVPKSRHSNELTGDLRRKVQRIRERLLHDEGKKPTPVKKPGYMSHNDMMAEAVASVQFASAIINPLPPDTSLVSDSLKKAAVVGPLADEMAEIIGAPFKRFGNDTRELESEAKLVVRNFSTPCGEEMEKFKCLMVDNWVHVFSGMIDTVEDETTHPEIQRQLMGTQLKGLQKAMEIDQRKTGYACAYSLQKFEGFIADIDKYLQCAEKLGVPVWNVTAQVLAKEEIKSADREFDALCKELSLEEKKTPATSGKAKKSALQKAHTPKADAGTRVPEQRCLKTAGLRSAPKPQSQKKAQHFSFDDRVLRWTTDNLVAIREFIDKDADGVLVQPYAHCSLDHLKKMKAYHDLRGSETLVFNEKYAFPSRTGVGMAGCIQREGFPAVFGFIYFGINHKGCIYHLFFEELDPFKHKGLSVFNGAPPPLPTDIDTPGASNSEWTLKGRYTHSLSAQEIITFTYPTDNYSISIYPRPRKAS